MFRYPQPFVVIALMSRPNILLFMSDNQPADLLGCYGNDEVKTPHLDGLAARGVRFDNAFCVNAKDKFSYSMTQKRRVRKRARKKTAFYNGI